MNGCSRQNPAYRLTLSFSFKFFAKFAENSFRNIKHIRHQVNVAAAAHIFFISIGKALYLDRSPV